MAKIFQRNKLELFAILNIKYLRVKLSMLIGSLFNTFCQFVMSFVKDHLTIELTIVDYSLRPKK